MPGEEDAECLFPRGGGEETSNKDDKRTSAERSKKRERPTAQPAREDAVTSLTFKSLGVGMMLLGVVRGFVGQSVVVSLPCSLLAHVDRKELLIPVENTQALDKVIKIGQILRMVISQLTRTSSGRKRVVVTMDPDVVNVYLSRESMTKGRHLYGVVRTVEDHGYAISFGRPHSDTASPSHFGGFLLADLAPRECLLPGTPIDCVVIDNVGSRKKIPRVLRVSARHDVVSKAITSEYPGMAIENLQPGIAVSARVQKIDEKGAGLVLIFLTFFKGSVDIFHLGKPLADFNPGDMVTARILFVDPALKRVGLTLLPDLIHKLCPPAIHDAYSNGAIFHDTVIRRIDNNIGLLLSREETPGVMLYAHISRVSDKQVDQLRTNFKLGQVISCRVVNYAEMDGLVLVSLQESVVSRTLFSYADVHVGKVLQAKVRSLQKYGCIMALESDIQALVPTDHLADIKLRKPQAKFKEDAIVRIRILSVDIKNKRIIATARTTLVDSNLPMVSSIDQAIALLGRKVQSYVIGVTNKLSVRVALGGNIQGVITRDHLGLLEADIDGIEKVFPLGRALGVWLLKVGRNGKGLMATLRGEEAAKAALGPSSAPQNPDIVLGSRVAVELVDIRESDIIVNITTTDPPVEATILHSHLTDYLHLVPVVLKRIRADPARLPKVMVLSIGKSGRPFLTCKKSLQKAKKAGELPSTLADLAILQGNGTVLLSGCVRRALPHGIIVGFLGDCCGYVRKSRIADCFVADPETRVTAGQSVKVRVESVDASENKALLSMRSSDLAELDTSLVERKLRGYFKEREDLEGGQFSIGEIADVTVDSVKSHGTVFRLNADTLGVALQSQIPPESRLKPTDTCKARLLDYDEVTGLFDLSLASSLLKKSKKSNPVLAAGIQTSGVVQLVRDEYVVLSCPKFGNAIVFGNAKEINGDAMPSELAQGTTLGVTVIPSKGDKRTLVVIDLDSKKITKKITSCEPKVLENVGDEVKGKISAITPSQVNVSIRPGVVGRLHLSETTDVAGQGLPFEKFTIGNMFTGTVAALSGSETTGFRLELTHRSSSPTILEAEAFWNILEQPGHQLVGFVKSKSESAMWLHLTPHISGCVTPLMLKDVDAAYLNEGHPFRDYSLQQAVACRVVCADRKKQHVDLEIGNDVPGKPLSCRVSKMLPGKGLSVALPRSRIQQNVRFGIVPITEIADNFVDTESVMNGKSEIKVGSYVRAVLLSEDNTKVDLSLRASLCGGEKEPTDPALESASDCIVGAKIRGFVRASTKKGCFVNLGRKLVGRILVSDLSDGFVQDVEIAFPIGKLVTGRVKSSTDGQVDITLRSALDELGLLLQSFKINSKARGIIKSVQDFGIFVGLGKGVVGLCHKSEVSDEHIPDLRQKFSSGQKVEVVIAKVDASKSRVSLSMKRSALSSAVEEESSDSEGGPVEVALSDNQASASEMESDSEDDESGSALEVPGGFDFSDDDGDARMDETGGIESDDESEGTGKKRKTSSKEKRTIKRQKAERAKEVNAKEEALIDAKGNPETAEDFERLIMGAPNVSVTWIRYMAFFLSQTQISKAREIAQRALKTIFYREVAEKLNVWLAYINLEAIYGNSEDAVMSILREAAKQVNDKHLYLQAFESLKTRKPDLAESIYQLALKKHKTSKKVWVIGGQAMYEKGNLEDARNLLIRALLALPKRKHVAITLKFAQFEYKYGSVEHGRTAFEGLIGNNAKRVDLWSVYIDMEIRALRQSSGAHTEVEFVRTLMRRCCSLDLSSKKMKFFFKRFLELEHEFGDEDSMDVVKTLARQYVESKME